MLERLRRLVESQPFRLTVMGLILVNAAVIGAETDPGIALRYGRLLDAADRAILWVFVAELSLRFLAADPPWRYFWNGWSLFDMILVGSGFVEGIEYLTVLRLLRIIRIFRTVTILPRMRAMVLTLLHNLPALGHVLVLLGVLFYAYGTAGTHLFRDADPERFGSLDRTLLTLYGILTLEGWIDVMQSVSTIHPHAWIYFVTFILLGTFVTMNLLVGVIVSNVQKADEEEDARLIAEMRQTLARIEARIDSLYGRPDA